MADLTTYAQVEAELAATAAYDANDSVSEANRRVAALRRKLDFAESSDENGRAITFNHQVVLAQIDQALAFIRANPTEAQRLANPDVVHADFSTFGRYAQ